MDDEMAARLVSLPVSYVQELIDALAPFAQAARRVPDFVMSNTYVVPGDGLFIADLRNAAKALIKVKEELGS